MAAANEAILSNEKNFTVFRYGRHTIRFRAPYSLEYYTEVKDGEEYEDVQRLIHQVGEPIYRDNLEKLVSIHKAEDKNWQIREMQKEIQQLEERIQRLKHD